MDARTAPYFADIVTKRDRESRPIGVMDAWIAAVCRRHDVPLATRNVRDFDGTGIDVINPWGDPDSRLDGRAHRERPVTDGAPRHDPDYVAYLLALTRALCRRDPSRGMRALAPHGPTGLTHPHARRIRAGQRPGRAGRPGAIRC